MAFTIHFQVGGGGLSAGGSEAPRVARVDGWTGQDTASVDDVLPLEEDDLEPVDDDEG